MTSGRLRKYCFAERDKTVLLNKNEHSAVKRPIDRPFHRAALYIRALTEAGAGRYNKTNAESYH